MSLLKKNSYQSNEKSTKYGNIELNNIVLSPTILRFDLQSDSNKLSLIPNHRTVYKNSKFEYSFLSYSQNHKSREHLEEFFTNLGYNTQRIGAKNRKIVEKVLISSVMVLKDSNSTKIQLLLDNFNNVYIQKQLKLSIHYDEVLAQYYIHSDSFDNFFHVSEFINSVKSTLAESGCRDKLILNCLYNGLKGNKKKDLKLFENSLQYIEFSNSQGYFRRIGVVISVKSEIINTQLLLLARVEDTNNNFEGFSNELQQESNLTEEVQSNLGMYLKEINHNMSTGQFMWTGNLRYRTSYYSSQKLNDSFLLSAFIRDDLKLLNLHIPNFIKILFKPHFDINNVLSCGMNLRVQQRFKMNTFELSPDEFSAEILILKILKNSKSSYLKNRFFFQKTKVVMNLRVVKYFFPSQFSIFEEFLKVSPNAAIQSINSLIAELLSMKLTFFGDSFPIDHFSWHEEKPVFTYQVPLHKILQHTPEKNPDFYLESIKNSVQIFIIQFHSTQLSHKIQIYTQEHLKLIAPNLDLIHLPLKFAEERLRLYNQNRISRCIKYYGLRHFDNKTYLISSNTFKTSLNQFFPDLNARKKIKTLKNIFSIIEEISLKNSEFCCFDPESIGMVNEHKLVLKFVARDEVDPIYKAPEVLNGRSSRSSLIFSFGKIVQFCFSSLTSQEKIKLPWIESLASECCETKAVGRLNLNQLKIRIEKL